MSEHSTPKEVREAALAGTRGEHSQAALALAERVRNGEGAANEITESAAEPDERAALLLSQGHEAESAALEEGGKELPERQRNRLERMQGQEMERLTAHVKTAKPKRGFGFDRLLRAGVIFLVLAGAGELAGCASTGGARASGVDAAAARVEYIQKDGEFETKWGAVEKKKATLEKAFAAFDAAQTNLDQAYTAWTAALGTDEEHDATVRLAAALEKAQEAEEALTTAQAEYEAAMQPNYPTDTPDAAKTKMQNAHIELARLEGLKTTKEQAAQALEQTRRKHGEHSSEYGTANGAYETARDAYKAAGGNDALRTAEAAFAAADEEKQGFAERSAAREAVGKDATGNTPPLTGIPSTDRDPFENALDALATSRETGEQGDRILQEKEREIKLREPSMRGFDGQQEQRRQLIANAERDIAAAKRAPHEWPANFEQTRTQDRDRFQGELSALDAKQKAFQDLRLERDALRAAQGEQPTVKQRSRETARRAGEQYQTARTEYRGRVDHYRTAQRAWDTAYGASAAHAKIDQLRAVVFPAQRR